MRGYSYDRRDVTGRSLANAYAQTLGTIFTEQPKPYEVEICVAEIGRFGSSTPAQLYRITYDGSIADEQEFVVMGGTTEPIVTAMRESYQRDLDLESAVRIAVGALQKGGPAPAGTTEAEPRTLDVSALEVAVLDSNRPRRAFKRIAGTVLEEMLPAPAAVEDAPPANGDAPS